MVQTFKSTMMKFDASCGLGLTPMPNLKKSLQRIRSFGAICTNKCQFWRIYGLLTFWKPQQWSLAWGCRPGTPSPTPNFAKIVEGHSPLLNKFIPKVANFAILWAMIPHSLGHKSEISVRVRTWDSLAQSKLSWRRRPLRWRRSSSFESCMSLSLHV